MRLSLGHVLVQIHVEALLDRFSAHRDNAIAISVAIIVLVVDSVVLSVGRCSLWASAEFAVGEDTR